MPYDNNHSIDDCDKCLKRVGRENLTPCKYLYLDRNDDMHPEIIIGSGYRKYYICESCRFDDEKITAYMEHRRCFNDS